jgi:cation/acetate symporter
MPIGFMTIWVWIVSILDKSPHPTLDKAGFLGQSVRSETGFGADGVSGH